MAFLAGSGNATRVSLAGTGMASSRDTGVSRSRDPIAFFAGAPSTLHLHIPNTGSQPPLIRLLGVAAEGTTNQQFGRRQKIFIFKGVDPWVASWNVVFPEEVGILMSLSLESVEPPLDNCWTSSTGRPSLRRSRALAA